MALFRFMDLEIWKSSIELDDEIYSISEVIEASKKFRMAEQLRSTSLSICNNIAEGSGSHADKDFANFLNTAHRSVFETVNLLIIANRRNFISESHRDNLLLDLNILAKRIITFKKSLNS